MTDALKEMVDAFRQRLTSPIIGSTIFAFIVVNWQPIFYVLFADKKVLKRFEYWTDYWSKDVDYWCAFFLPLLIGIGYAVIAPLIALLSALVTRWPKEQLRLHTDRSAYNVALAKVNHSLGLERRREDLIASRLRQQESLGDIVDQKEREDFKSGLDESDVVTNQPDLSIFDKLDVDVASDEREMDQWKRDNLSEYMSLAELSDTLPSLEFIVRVTSMRDKEDSRDPYGINNQVDALLDLHANLTMQENEYLLAGDEKNASKVSSSMFSTANKIKAMYRDIEFF